MSGKTRCGDTSYSCRIPISGMLLPVLVFFVFFSIWLVSLCISPNYTIWTGSDFPCVPFMFFTLVFQVKTLCSGGYQWMIALNLLVKKKL